MIKKTYNSIFHALNGLKTIWKEEHNFRIENLVSLLIVFCIFYFQFTFIESALCVIAITIVLCSEIINTVIEDLCNKIEPNQDPVIGKIKDTMAFFVFMACVGAIVIGLLVFYHHFLL